MVVVRSDCVVVEDACLKVRVIVGSNIILPWQLTPACFAEDMVGDQVVVGACDGCPLDLDTSVSMMGQGYDRRLGGRCCVRVALQTWPSVCAFSP